MNLNSSAKGGKQTSGPSNGKIKKKGHFQNSKNG